MSKKLQLIVVPGVFAVCRLGASDQLPAWATQSAFFSISRTFEELSVVCLQNDVPITVQAERGWKIFKVMGPLDFALTGILASLAAPLAQAQISIFAVSTYDTDYVLVKEEAFQKAHRILAEQFSIND